MPTPAGPKFFDDVAQAFGPDFLLRDESDLLVYGKDWTRVFTPNPCAIALPRTTEEVSRLVRICAEHDVAIVPSGGRTGLAGGAVAANGELVLSLSRMRKMHDVDLLGATVRVEAGAVTEEVHRHAGEHGLTWPVDFASKGSSQVGGNIATNAGGVKVIRYGLTRQWVLGLEVVLASGEVMRVSGALEKNNTGIDLRQLFIGSEGTLGIITEATLKLCRPSIEPRVMLFAVSDLAAVLRLFRDARKGPFTINAYEFFTEQCVARLERHRKVRLPFQNRASHYVLLEVESHLPDELEAWVTHLFEDAIVLDGTLGQHSAQAAELWMLREGISESLSSTGLPHKNDIALPVALLEAFCGDLEAMFKARYEGWEIANFGHIGDGNLHVNIMKPDAMDKHEFLAKTKLLDREMFELVRTHSGSVSAEHGIGLLKKGALGYTRTASEIELMRGIKRLLDPKGLMNPGKIFDV